MGIISIGVGTCTLGRRQLDKDGNVVKETPAKWEADPEGSSVAIVPLNPGNHGAGRPGGGFRGLAGGPISGKSAGNVAANQKDKPARPGGHDPAGGPGWAGPVRLLRGLLYVPGLHCKRMERGPRRRIKPPGQNLPRRKRRERYAESKNADFFRVRV